MEQARWETKKEAWEGLWGKGGYGEVKQRWQAVSEGRKDRSQRGEGRTSGNVDKKETERLIVKTSRSEYRSYQLLEEKLNRNVYPFTPKDVFPTQPPFLTPLLP